MAHFAQIDADNIVVNVLVVPDDQEHRGQEYLANDCNLGGTWIQTSYNARIRKNFAGIGMVYLPEHDAFAELQPEKWFVFNSETGQWDCPDNLNPFTGVEWADGEQEQLQFEFAKANVMPQIEHLFDNYNEREKIHFRLFGATPKDPQFVWHEGCNAHEYMMTSLSEVTHGSSDLSNQVPSSLTGGKIDDLVDRFQRLVEIPPIGYLIFGVGIDDSLAAEKNLDFVPSEYRHQVWAEHPQSVGRSLPELMRLVIEWDWCYHNLDSREPAAVTAHDFMRATQMPADVQAELLLVPDQAVAKFLNNDPDALAETEPSLPNTPLLKDWMAGLVVKYGPLEATDPLPVNMDSLSETHP